MSGRFLHKVDHVPPHRCPRPPVFRVEKSDTPEDNSTRLVTELGAGSVWRCDCGQHWVVDEWAMGWDPVSPRKAKRLLRKAAQT